MSALANVTSEPTTGIRVEPRPECMLCGSAGQQLYDALVDDSYGVPGRWALRECGNVACGLVWQDPMIAAQDLLRAYAKYHTHDNSGAGIGSSSPDRAFLRFDRWSARLLGLAAERARFSQAFLDDLPHGAMLDVGCGLGNFAAEMQKRGWVVRGTDFDAKAVDYVMQNHGFPVDVGDLHEIAYPANAFDAVTVRHVIEHVREPFRFVGECWRILRPGGRLVFITPNMASLGHRIFRRHWRGLEPPRHLFLYGPKALRLLAAACGIRSASIFSTAQGANYIFRSSEETRTGRVAAGASPRALAKFCYWQMREVRGIRSGRDDCGEELVLVADKPA